MLRRWRPADAEIQEQAVTESLEHLRPWMPWVAFEPQSLARRRRCSPSGSANGRRAGTSTSPCSATDRVAGSAGLHHRGGPGVLEIGYWIHPALTRQGLATTVARLLTDAAFSVPGIERVEIHHDQANVASAGVPRQLGYTLVAETPDDPDAPGEIGIECTWSVTREAWALLHR